MSCNYWMSHKSRSERNNRFSHRRICSKWVTWTKTMIRVHTTNFNAMKEEEELKVLKWPCQSPDLNHVGMWRVSETRISCLLSWSGSVWIVWSKLIPSGITAAFVYIAFYIGSERKQTVFWICQITSHHCFSGEKITVQESWQILLLLKRMPSWH